MLSAVNQASGIVAVAGIVCHRIVDLIRLCGLHIGGDLVVRLGRAVRGSHAQARKLGQYSPVRDLARQVPPTNRLPGGNPPQASRGENLYVPAFPADPCPMSEKVVPATIRGISLIHPNSFL